MSGAPGQQDAHDHAALVGERVVRLLGAHGSGSSRPVLVCVDGRSGSGKTTLARRVARRLRDAGVSVTVLHLDHVYPGWDGLAATATLVGERLLPRLRAGDEPTYPSWSWVRDRPGPDVVVRQADVVLVEGVGSAGRESRTLADLVVWLEAPEHVRRARAMARDGESYRPHWQRWADQEAGYVAAEDPAGGADLVLPSVSVDPPSLAP